MPIVHRETCVGQPAPRLQYLYIRCELRGPAVADHSYHALPRGCLDLPSYQDRVSGALGDTRLDGRSERFLGQQLLCCLAFYLLIELKSLASSKVVSILRSTTQLQSIWQQQM